MWSEKELKTNKGKNEWRVLEIGNLIIKEEEKEKEKNGYGREVRFVEFEQSLLEIRFSHIGDPSGCENVGQRPVALKLSHVVHLPFWFT